MPGSPGARGHSRGIAVKPEAVRRARMERGLSLTELAGGQVTRAAIHLVETGKMRPSMRTLQLIAKRTGRPISYFLAGAEGSEEQLRARDELLSLVDSGELPAAVAAANDLLLERLEPGLEADVRLALGRALVRMIEGDQALPHLARARQLFERVGDAWMVAQTLVQESTAMFLVRDPRTLQCGLEALDRCERLEPPDPALHASALNVLGNISRRAHDWRSAARFFAMGLEASRDVVDLRQTARLYDGLSAAQQSLGDFASALRSAERAAALYATDPIPVTRVRAENNLGYALLRQGELAAAAVHLHRALALCDENQLERRSRANVQNSLGELYLAQGKLNLAVDHLQTALEVAVRVQEPDPEASALHLLARAWLRLGDVDAADRSYTAAIELLQRLDVPERLRQCATEYAEHLHERGRLEESITYWRIAARAAAPVAASDENVVLLRKSGA